MTVSTSTNEVVYRGNGSTTAFPVPFKILEASHLRVARRIHATGEEEEVYTGTDYSFSGYGAASGTLTLSGIALSSTYELVIERTVPETQDLDIVNAGGFYPESVEEQFDLIVMMVQQLAAKVGRTVRVKAGNTLDEIGPDRAGKFIGFDADDDIALLSGTGSDSALRTDLAAVTGSTLVKYRPNVYATARSVSSRLQDTILATDYGLVGDNSTINDAAMENLVYTANPSWDVLPIRFPRGTYRFSKQFIPRRRLELMGEGMEGSTSFVFHNIPSMNATMKGAMAFGLANTLASYTSNPDSYPVSATSDRTGGGSDFSRISNIDIYITGTRPAGLHHGIWSAARVTLENVHIHFGGFKFLGNTLITGSGTITGNANECRLTNCRSYYATEDGFMTDGGDANGGRFDACLAYAAARHGFFDSSFLGNLYTGCLREGVQAGVSINGYRSEGGGGVNNSVFFACYEEGDLLTGSHWNVESPGLIIQPLGQRPETNLGAGYNTVWGSSLAAGLVTNEMINIAADGLGSALGSATVRAIRLNTNGLLIRGEDNLLYSFVAGGGSVYLTRDNVNVLRLLKGAAIADVTGGATVDTEARTAINAILARMRALTPTIAT